MLPSPILPLTTTGQVLSAYSQANPALGYLPLPIRIKRGNDQTKTFHRATYRVALNDACGVEPRGLIYPSIERLPKWVGRNSRANGLINSRIQAIRIGYLSYHSSDCFSNVADLISSQVEQTRHTNTGANSIVQAVFIIDIFLQSSVLNSGSWARNVYWSPMEWISMLLRGGWGPTVVRIARTISVEVRYCAYTQTRQVVLTDCPHRTLGWSCGNATSLEALR